jgi:hypothetical protein
MPRSFNKLNKETEHNPKKKIEYNLKNKSSIYIIYMAKTI